ncbi:helix-turn-helix domain-containing protein [Flavivirga amylovorans]
MYLYIKAETNNNFHFKLKHILHYLPFILLSIYFLSTFHFHTIEEKSQLLISKEIFKPFFRKINLIFIGVQVFIYNILAIISIEKFSKNNDSKNSFILSKIRWNKFIIYGYFIACTSNAIAKLLLVYTSISNITAYLYVSAILFLLYFLVILGKALFSSHFGGSIKKDKSLAISKNESEILNSKLKALMKEEKTFLQFGLTISELASQMNVKERLLSQFINSHYNMTFQDFINLYRINEAKKLIEQYIDSRKTILEIIYESGFNSKSAFNAAFKKHTQTTPTEYKKSFK